MPPARKFPADLETDPKKVLELLVGLPEVSVLGVDCNRPVVDLHLEKVAEPVGCPTCGVLAQFKGWREVVLVDLQAFGKPTRLHWHKRRWRCVDVDCRDRVVDRAGSADRRATDGYDRPGRPLGDRSSGALRDVRSPKWPRSLAATGTPSTTPFSVMAKRSSTIRIASVPSAPSGSTRCSSPRRGSFHAKEFATSIVDVGRASSSTSFLVAEPRPDGVAL